ncbi:MAG: HNH endonuclease [Malazfec virus 1]
MNEIYTYSSYAVMVIKHKGSNVLVYISSEDVEKVQEKKWCINSKGYVCSDSGALLLHRYLMEAGEEQVVDHINGNTLNNHKNNLRVCTCSENSTNRVSAGKIGVPNIAWDSGRNKWKINIKIDGKTHSKRFSSIEEALAYREEIVSKLPNGEFRPQLDYLRLFSTTDEELVEQLLELGYMYVQQEGNVCKFILSELLKKDLKKLQIGFVEMNS